MSTRVEFVALEGIPEVREGMDIGELIAQALQRTGESLRPGDILAIAQKVVSKSEGRFRAFDEIEPSARALEISEQSGKDPRKVQAILDESTEIVRISRTPPDGVIIARHKQGWVCANAGIDESNLGGAEGMLLLLPSDPDASARNIATVLERHCGVRPGVVVTDTFGRPWRKGILNIALGSSDVPAMINWVGREDAYGRQLHVTQQAFADEIAAAAGLLMVKDAATPAVLIRGLQWQPDANASCAHYVRAASEDLFR